jgi:hypothetical protein
MRQRWVLSQSYFRMKKLYKELVSAMDKKDIEAVVSKVNAIVEGCQATLLEMTTDDEAYSKLIQNALLELASTDWSSIFIEMIDLIDQELARNEQSESVKLLVEMMSSCLSRAENILTDERYKPMIAHTPSLIGKVLDILEKLNAKEAKTLAVRVIGTLGQNDMNKVEIGKLDGFRKILSLLVEGDKDLTMEITKAMKHLVELTSDASENSSFSSFWVEKVSRLAENVKVLLSYDSGQKSAEPNHTLGSA